MEEHGRITIWSNSGEAKAAFQGRLSAFWSKFLRVHEAEFEGVYAEQHAFETRGDCLGKIYQFALPIHDTLTAMLTAEKFTYDRVDTDDVYNKYEATPPDWFQIEH
jgi:hypothetical protein